MKFKPNDLPEMELGEIREFTRSVYPQMGSNAIQSAAATSDRLTIGTPTYSGHEITFSVTASETGWHNIILTANLDNDQVLKGFVRVRVVDSTDNYEHRYV